MSFIHNNSYNSLKKSGRSSVSGAQINKVSEPRLFFVAINSLGTDADEVITEDLPQLIKRECYKRFHRKTRWQQPSQTPKQPSQTPKQPSQTPAFTLQNPGYEGELHPIIVT